MTPTPAQTRADATAATLVLGLAAGLTLLRLAALALTPLQLYPDEAQYWLWSRELHWGYVSKPPMIAWLIWATTRLGDVEALVRLSAPVAHLVGMLALWRAGQRLYGSRVGALAAILYGLMPAVQVSALFIATDAPLMAFLALALWAYVALQQAPTPAGRRLAAAAFGAALGLAFLAKQAAVYVVIGAVLHAAASREARRAWGGWAWAAALAALLVVFAPNLAWQASHHFATIAHTTAVNARWSPGQMFQLGKLAEFVLGQLGIMGPVPFVVLIGGTIALARRRRLEPADVLLLCFVAPPLVLVTGQAFLSRAHSHWAAVSYLPGVILAAAWLERWRARGWTRFAIGLQGALAALLLAVVAFPQIVDATGNGRRLQRQRGWDGTAEIVVAAARATPGLTAVAVEDRYLFNELAYYGREYFLGLGAPPLRMRPPSGQALNEAELSSPLARGEGGRVLVAETVGRPQVFALPQEFVRIRPIGRFDVRLDPRRARGIALYLGEGYLGPVSRATTEP